MLAGHLKRTIEHSYYPVVITEVLTYLDTLNLHTLALGRHELPFVAADKAWFVVLEYEKQPAEKFFPEVHHHHSDFQIVVSGSETMGWELDSGTHKNAEEYLVERDLQFYKPDTVKINYFQALENQFYLFTPNTIHVTNIEDGNDDPVRKLVVKIHNDLLMVRA